MSGVSSKGISKGTQVTQMLTFVARPTTSQGVLHGKGGGITMAGELGLATFTGEAVGKISSSSGSISWRGSIFYSTSSNGNLSFLNNMIVLFEAEIDSDGNFSHKAWEWK